MGMPVVERRGLEPGLSLDGSLCRCVEESFVRLAGDERCQL